MSIEARIHELSSRHSKLDDALHDEQKRPGPDALHMTRLKREKLKLKEEIKTLQERRTLS